MIADYAIGAELARFRAGLPDREERTTQEGLSQPREQRAGRPLDARADVHALAAVLCEVLTLAPPPAPESAGGSISRPEIGGVPWEIAAVLKLGMAREPDTRPATARQLAELFRTAVQQSSARGAPTWSRRTPTRQPNPFESGGRPTQPTAALDPALAAQASAGAVVRVNTGAVVAADGFWAGWKKPAVAILVIAALWTIRYRPYLIYRPFYMIRAMLFRQPTFPRTGR